MTLFLDIQNQEMQNLKSKLFLGISKEFGISVGGLSWGMPLIRRVSQNLESSNQIENLESHFFKKWFDLGQSMEWARHKGPRTDDQGGDQHSPRGEYSRLERESSLRLCLFLPRMENQNQQQWLRVHHVPHYGH